MNGTQIIAVYTKPLELLEPLEPFEPLEPVKRTSLLSCQKTLSRSCLDVV
jgi:hypothetical protein